MSLDSEHIEIQSPFKEGFYKSIIRESKGDVFRALGLQKNGVYTNLALLLSDQCKHTIKIAVYQDETCTMFRDRKEFTGSILKQLESTTQYLSLVNKTASTINGIYRIDKQDYPPEAIREALLNAIVHRDYSFSGSIIINVNDHQMEFISLGGLMPGLSKEDLQVGLSQERNKNLADVFYRPRFIESYGTSIRRIYRAYENCSIQPEIITSSNAFKIILPNMNEVQEQPNSKCITAQMKKTME